MPTPVPATSARAAVPLALLVVVVALAPAATAQDVPDAPVALQQEGDRTVRYTVEAHDVGDDAAGEGDYWFTWNATGDVRNPPALLPAGTHVVITFVNEGAQAHNLHIGGGIDEQTELLDSGEEETLEFDVPEDAPEEFEYWCDPHRPFGMAGNATSSQARFEEMTTEELTVHGHDEGGQHYWFTTDATDHEIENPPILLKPGFTYEVTFVNEGDEPHNLHFGGPLDNATELIDAGEEEQMRFTVPSDAPETFDYWCDPHQTLGMEGTVHTSEAGYREALEELAPGEEHVDIEALGVDYLAYWVGVIAFATLFVVYGLYFFLFKYGESFTSSDHKGRKGGPDAEEARRNRRVGWVLFAGTVALVAALTAWQQGLL